MKSMILLQSIKAAVILFCFLMIGCSSQEKTEQAQERQAPEVINKDETQTTIPEPILEDTQDSSIEVPVDTTLIEALTSSLLQEHHRQGLVVLENDEFSFVLPFDLHAFDCGAPDCYTTELSFGIPASAPVEYPDTIAVRIFEHGGCIDEEFTAHSLFMLTEASPEYVNYFSSAQTSNLIIKRNGALYYFPHLETTSISVNTLERMFKNDELIDAKTVPYRSTRMTLRE